MQRSGNDRFFSPFGEWKSDKNNARFGQLTNTLSSGISLRRFIRTLDCLFWLFNTSFFFYYHYLYSIMIIMIIIFITVFSFFSWDGFSLFIYFFPLLFS